MSKGRILKSVADMAAELGKKKSVLSREEAEANLRRMLEQSKVQQRLYHGTTATEGNKGDEAIRRIKSSKEGSLGSGAYLTPQPDRANLYTRPSRPDAGGNVLPVYAQIRNPLILDGPSNRDPMIEALTKLGMDEQKASRMVDRAYENKGYIGKEVESRARAAGYDGLMQYRDGELAEVVSYNPNAIKSAISNEGTYDTSVPDLSKAEGGAVRKTDGGIMEAIEAAKMAGKPRSRPIAGPRQRIDIEQMRREVEENARRVAEVKAELTPPAEMTEYNPTLQQKLGTATERGLRAIGSPAPRARELSGVLTGGSTGSPLPLGMSVLDFTPAAIPVYGGQGAMNAADEAGKGNYGKAALELGLAGLDLAPGVPATRALARAAKPMVKAGAKAMAPKMGDLAEQYMMKTGMALPIDVWHGSPHRFPPTKKNPLGEFDASKIGTGAGGQAYGQGHYMAEAPKVAKNFAPRDPDYEDKLMRMYKQAERKQDYASMEVLENAMLHNTPEELLSQHPEHKALIDKIAGIPQKGSLYKVDLPDEQIAKMLNYDKPINQHSDELKALLEKAGINAESSATAGSMIKGQEEYLAKHGIPGIYYLDDASRDAGEGTRNFVVFPGGEDMLTIKERMKDGGKVKKPVSMDAMRLAVGGSLVGEVAKRAAKAAQKGVQYTATDRARAGIDAAEMIKRQEQVRASEALGQLMEKGIKKVSTTQSDRTRVGGGNIGGANFPAISLVDPEYAGKVWGVGDKPTAARLTNLSSPETAWTTMLGSANQLKTNPIVFDRMKRKFLTEMRAGNLSAELEKKIDKNLELTFGEGASIRDPKIWKEADTFDKRSALADIMMGQGIPPSKGGVSLGGEKSGRGVIFKPSEILTKETEPSLLNPEHGGDVPTYALGPRLFSLGKETYYRPDLHPGFPQLIEGKDFGFNVKPTPTEVFLPDWRERFKEKFPERKAPPGYYDLSLGLKGEGLPSQELNDEYIRHLIREGFKKGGPVKKAAGGIASIPHKVMRAFVEAGKKAKLTEQAKEAASKGELFLPEEETRRMQRELLQGVKRPEELAEGGQITSDDLILEERAL